MSGAMRAAGRLFILLLLLPAMACAASGDGAIRRIDDLAYGQAERQKLDVYLSASGHKNAPVIVMVHGGAWMIGDKAHRGVVANKAAYWVPQGYILVSVNYRMVPEADAFTQAMDVAAAVAYVQRHAAEWGGNPDALVLMGHSAGAHLVGLLSANPRLASVPGLRPWKGAVLLDSAALDVVTLMSRDHRWFFDKAFGSDKAFWRQASPLHQLTAGAPPMMLVCSLRRGDVSCGAAQRFHEEAARRGVKTVLNARDFTHKEINVELGKPGDYTTSVAHFIAALVR